LFKANSDRIISHPQPFRKAAVSAEIANPVAHSAVIISDEVCAAESCKPVKDMHLKNQFDE